MLEKNKPRGADRLYLNLALYFEAILSLPMNDSTLVHMVQGGNKLFHNRPGL